MEGMIAHLPVIVYYDTEELSCKLTHFKTIRSKGWGSIGEVGW